MTTRRSAAHEPPARDSHHRNSRHRSNSHHRESHRDDGRDRATRRWTQDPLLLFSVATAGITLLFAAGIVLDPRTIGGQPAWLKPLKFGVSIAIYTLTIAWLLAALRSANPNPSRWLRGFARALVWTIVVVFTAELAAIVLQVLRGTTSHFNLSSGFDAGVWVAMGVAVAVLWFANFALAGVLLFQRFSDPVLAWSLRLGVVIAVLGMGQAFLMTSPSAQQLAGWSAGEPVSIVGAHSVGSPDGGAGLPVTGWRADAGDLRVGHFVGIHGLQAIPLFGWLVRRRSRLDARRQVALVWVAAAAYFGLGVLVTWQALRAQPLLQPDALTLWALAGLVGATLVATLAIGRAGASGPDAPDGVAPGEDALRPSGTGA